VDALQVDLNWVSPTSENKSVPTGLAVAAVEAEDPRFAVVAQASFLVAWRGSPGGAWRPWRPCDQCVPWQRWLVAEPCQFIEQRYEYLLL
jgi:hypothetical protein